MLFSGAVIARESGVALGTAVAGSRMLREGLAVPLGGAVLMLLPVVVVRLLGPPTREALEGFMIGALGALMFNAAAMLTRLAPQLGAGVVSKTPLSILVVEAGIRGVAVPLIAAATGGLIGAALWFVRPDSKKHQRPGIVRLVPRVVRRGDPAAVRGRWAWSTCRGPSSG